jgi:hypothetical protein
MSQYSDSAEWADRYFGRFDWKQNLQVRSDTFYASPHIRKGSVFSCSACKDISSGQVILPHCGSGLVGLFWAFSIY